MINFDSHTDFELKNKQDYADWLSSVIKIEKHKEGELTVVFCDDAYLHSLNLKFLGHDYLTDILTFNYNVGGEINGDICISIDRVKENALKYNNTFERELARVLVHGVLHLCGYKDQTQAQKSDMRTKENFYLSSFFSQ